MEVELEGETEIGECEISCPLCNGFGSLFRKTTEYTITYGRRIPRTNYEEIPCPCCGGKQTIETDVGEQYVYLTGEIDIEPSYNEGYY